MLLLARHYRQPQITTMSYLRSPSSLRLCRTIPQISRTSTSRCLSTSPARRLGEPDPKAIPDVAAMQSTEDQATLVEVAHKPEPEQGVGKYHQEHQPDYTATVDHGTSTYSPVPKRVLNGSEPGGMTPAAVLSGAPVDLQARTVRYETSLPQASPAQSGGIKTLHHKTGKY